MQLTYPMFLKVVMVMREHCLIANGMSVAVAFGRWYGPQRFYHGDLNAPIEVDVLGPIAHNDNLSRYR